MGKNFQAEITCIGVRCSGTHPFTALLRPLFLGGVHVAVLLAAAFLASAALSGRQLLRGCAAEVGLLGRSRKWRTAEVALANVRTSLTVTLLCPTAVVVVVGSCDMVYPLKEIVRRQGCFSAIGVPPR